MTDKDEITLLQAVKVELAKAVRWDGALPVNMYGVRPSTIPNSKMNKITQKYEFVPGDEIVGASGQILKRIRAVVAIVAIGVSAGEVG